MVGGDNGFTSAVEAITGTRYAWTKPGKEIYQDITVPVTGTYKLSANARATATVAKLGIRKKDGTLIASVDVKNKDTMIGPREEITGISLQQGDQIQVFYGDGDSFSHIEDVQLLRDDTATTNLTLNNTFANGSDKWTFDPHVTSVPGSVYIPPNESIRQTIRVPMKGPYKVSAEVLEGSGTIAIVKNSSVFQSVDVQKNGSVEIPSFDLDMNDEVQLIATSKTGFRLGNINFFFDSANYANHAPVVTEVTVKGIPWTDQLLSSAYTYSDMDGNREGTPEYTWLASETKDGVYTPINGETSQTLKTTASLNGKFLKSQVVTSDIFGKKSDPILSDAFGVILSNILVNASFDDEKHGRVGDGAFTTKSGTNGTAYLDPNPEGYLYQTLTVPKTGNYDLTTMAVSSDEEATYGVRLTNGGTVLKSGTLSKSSTANVQKLSSVYLVEGQAIDVFYNSIDKNGAYVRIDNVGLTLSDTTEVSSNDLINISVAGELRPATIDVLNKKATLYLSPNVDLTNVVPTITLAKGSRASALSKDLTKVSALTILDSADKQANWTIEVKTNQNDISFESSNAELDKTFAWAKDKARSYIRTDKSGLINRDETNSNSPEIKAYIPSYWAGYAHRYAFYGRDFAHQTSGGEILGMKEENFNMLKSFAGTANVESKWYPAWALNFDGSIFKLDYESVDSFVREDPAVFELVEKANKMYQWTGDSRYITDPILTNYYEKALTDFISLHDTGIPNGVAEGTGAGIFEGVASYNERSGEAVLESGDSIGSQYQATLAFANLLEAQGNKDKAAIFRDKAVQLKALFNKNWVTKDAEGYIRGFESADLSHADFSKEASWFMPLPLG